MFWRNHAGAVQTMKEAVTCGTGVSWTVSVGLYGSRCQHTRGWKIRCGAGRHVVFILRANIVDAIVP